MKDLVFSLVILFVFGASSIAQDEVTPASIYNDGLAAMKAKDYENAFKLMTDALAKADPVEDEQVVRLANRNGAIAAYYYGSSLNKADNNAEAIEVYKKGTELNPDFYGNYVGLAKVYVDQDKVVDAVDHYLKAAEIRVKEGKADRADSYFENADKIIAIAYSKDMVDDALSACDLVIAKNENAEAHYYKAKALLDKNSESDALTHALKAHEMGGDADESKFIYLVAEIYEKTGNNSKAIEYYKQVGPGKYYDMAQYKVDQSQ